MRRTVLIACLLALLVIATKQQHVITLQCSYLAMLWPGQLVCSTCVAVENVGPGSILEYYTCSECHGSLVPTQGHFPQPSVMLFDAGAYGCVDSRHDIRKYQWFDRLRETPDLA